MNPYQKRVADIFSGKANSLYGVTIEIDPNLRKGGFEPDLLQYDFDPFYGSGLSFPGERASNGFKLRKGDKLRIAVKDRGDWRKYGHKYESNLDTQDVTAYVKVERDGKIVVSESEGLIIDFCKPGSSLTYIDLKVMARRALSILKDLAKQPVAPVRTDRRTDIFDYRVEEITESFNHVGGFLRDVKSNKLSRTQYRSEAPRIIDFALKLGFLVARMDHLNTARRVIEPRASSYGDTRSISVKWPDKLIKFANDQRRDNPNVTSREIAKRFISKNDAGNPALARAENVLSKRKSEITPRTLTSRIK